MSGREHTVILGMGCFWSPDALFGQLQGVIRTRVGYAGGTAPNPVYRKLGDHTEVVEVTFEPDRISFAMIVELFWSRHNPVNINDYKGRQYQSLLMYDSEEQLHSMQDVLGTLEEQGKGRPDTEIVPRSVFYPAENRHQKYYLKRYPDAVRHLEALYPSEEALTGGTLAARLNGLAKGYTNLTRIVQEIEAWPVSMEERQKLIRLVRQIRW